MKIALLGALFGTATAAASPVGPAPVIGGVREHHDPAVVALAMRGGSVYCSGTLVSPRIVVTAAHCLVGIAPPAYIFFGTDPAEDGVFIPVDSVMPHPDYKTSPTVDIGVVVLARPVTVQPMPLPDRDLAHPELTGMIRLVGFGDTEPADVYAPTGVKYGREVPLARIDSASLRYGVGTCHGDSGGATLAVDAAGTERLVGVISRGDADCVVAGASTRVDLYRPWIESWIANMDPPSCSLDQRCATDCASPDPDCAMEPDAQLTPDASGGCATSSGGGLALGLLSLGLVLRRRQS